MLFNLVWDILQIFLHCYVTYIIVSSLNTIHDYIINEKWPQNKVQSVEHDVMSSHSMLH